MKVRCSNCGAVHSLDALISNDAASEALSIAFRFSDLGKAWLQYLGLFRPAQSQLSFDRVVKITAEANADIEAEAIMRDGIRYDAPKEAWIWAIGQAIKARDEGRVKLPLKSHGYLYEIITAYKPDTSVALDQPQIKKQFSSKTGNGSRKQWHKALKECLITS